MFIAILLAAFIDLGEPDGHGFPSARLGNPVKAVRGTLTIPFDVPDPLPYVPTPEPVTPVRPPAPERVKETAWATDRWGILWYDTDTDNLSRWVAYRNSLAPVQTYQSFPQFQRWGRIETCQPGQACYRGR